MDFGDPEVESLEVDESGNVTARVRIVRSCADCGMDLKEASLDMEEALDLSGHVKEGQEDKHEFSIDEESVDQVEEGGGRYQKSYFGAEIAFAVTCSCDAAWKLEGKISDKVAASEMEELT